MRPARSEPCVIDAAVEQRTMDDPTLVEVLLDGRPARLARRLGEDIDALLSLALATAVERIDEMRRGVAPPRGVLH
jgi:hypothetical protein